jgi:tripartite-type tricarboxylate transporter receptor subunit TctC
MRTSGHAFFNRLRPACSAYAAVQLIALTIGGVFAADEYPARPVRLINPWAAGGPADFVGRLYAQDLTELWGNQVVTDNRPGAAGIIGTELVTRAPADGYTLLFSTISTFAINGILIKKIPYDVERDLELIGIPAIAPYVLAVRTDLPARGVPELIALAKKQPGKLSFASAGAGTIVHMAGEQFKYQAGIDILHVPFKSGAPALVGVLSNEVDMIVTDLSAVLTYVKSGRLRALAAAHTRRLGPLPDVPTFAELGLSGVESSAWWAFAAPAKTPRAVIARLRAGHAAVLARQDYIERLAALAMEPLMMTAEQTAAFVKREIEKWQKVVAAANVRID